MSDREAESWLIIRAISPMLLMPSVPLPTLTKVPEYKTEDLSGDIFVASRELA
jgi:hypothetical protein